ncbi:cell division protein FtsL [Melghirimyces algeriensis]|uniref:Cell division protein FtsL n=1 Tax=Melghirimyces algeriensis TaxID=910412 RepID=A0A521BM89_9BACL|nr:hypothetical protein [Melghirimyces algeriensis]SMO48219.1 cell division protein FtsL [Melghirimyces algeriensis]
MREYRGNTAIAYQPEPQPRILPKKKKRVQRKELPAREKILYMVSIVIFVVLASGILSRYAEVAELHMELQKMERQTAQLEEGNKHLQKKKNELRSADRIRQFAREKGMVMAEKSSISTNHKKEKKFSSTDHRG